MLPKNNGITENEILQNQFTAYVSRAIRNRRLKYLMNRSRRNSRELLFSEYQDYLASEVRTPSWNDSRTAEVRHPDR